MRLLPGLRPGPRWGAYGAPPPAGKDCASKKKCHLFGFFPNDMPAVLHKKIKVTRFELIYNVLAHTKINFEIRHPQFILHLI